jgi:hypothetical protein
VKFVKWLVAIPLSLQHGGPQLVDKGVTSTYGGVSFSLDIGLLTKIVRSEDCIFTQISYIIQASLT